MQSSNPILTRAEVSTNYGHPMTVEGAIQKSLLLTGVAAVVGIAVYLIAHSTNNMGLATASWLIGMIGSLILGLVMTFKSHLAPTLAIPYALFEGALLGGITMFFEMRYPGIATKALLATFVTTGVMLGLYKAGIIRATEKFKAIVIGATFAIMAVFLIQWVMVLAFGSSIPGLFEGGILGIGFAAFVAIIASLNLILDFDLIENAAAQRAEKSFEWLCGVALLATLVWMYISFLRLIGMLSDD
ncbi:Bax inhibitor-1/YccA family protein [Acinetobacter sp. c3-l95]|uniref:Bax inhibitor-1/YccA family protein n=1 Tax=Acinetobacter sp. c3-l95 TaxID=3342804 RepID=UPI0035B96BC0